MLLSRAFLALYWLFDNIQIVTQLKIFDGDQEKWGKRGMFAWWLSLICNLVQFVRSYTQADAQLKYYIKIGRQNEEKKQAFAEQYKTAKKQKFDALLNIVKTIGDLFPATKGSGKLRSDLRSWRQIQPAPYD